MKIIIIALASVSIFASQTTAESTEPGKLARSLALAGIILQQNDDHSAALAYFERAQREIDHPKLNYFRGKSLDALNKSAEALEEFRKIDGSLKNKKYALETKAYIRALEAEHKVEVLTRELARHKGNCSEEKVSNKVPWLLFK